MRIYIAASTARSIILLLWVMRCLVQAENLAVQRERLWEGKTVKLSKIVVLFLVSLTFLTIYNSYLADHYYDFTEGEGLGEVFLGHIMVLGAAFLLAFALTRNMDGENGSGGGEN